MMDLIGNMILAVHADLCQEFRLRDQLEDALKTYNKDLNPDKRVVVINKKQLARLESIVKELAEGVSYNHTDGFQYCAYCDGFQNDHDVDCLIVRARKAMEINP